MKEITITIDGVEYIARPKNETVTAEKPKTGYERVRVGETYYGQDEYCMVDSYVDDEDCTVNDDYKAANYYSSGDVAENNTRADTLMRKLRQWQALNDEPVDWNDKDSPKWKIGYDYYSNKPDTIEDYSFRDVGHIYFSSIEKAYEVIDAFRDELTWYFTEYQQRLDEPNIID